MQKRLDTRPRCGYNGASNSSEFYLAFALAQETCLIVKNFVHTRKKDLTFLAFALTLAQEPPSFSHVAFALAPARQKSRKIKIFGILAGRIFKGLEALVYKVE